MYKTLALIALCNLPPNDNASHRWLNAHCQWVQPGEWICPYTPLRRVVVVPTWGPRR